MGYQIRIIRNRIYIGEKEIALEKMDSLLAAKKKRKVHEEFENSQDAANSLTKSKKGRLSNRDLLMLDKNNLSMKDFLWKNADGHVDENSQQRDQMKPA